MSTSRWYEYVRLEGRGEQEVADLVHAHGGRLVIRTPEVVIVEGNGTGQQQGKWEKCVEDEVADVHLLPEHWRVLAMVPVSSSGQSTSKSAGMRMRVWSDGQSRREFEGGIVRWNSEYQEERDGDWHRYHAKELCELMTSGKFNQDEPLYVYNMTVFRNRCARMKRFLDKGLLQRVFFAMKANGKHALLATALGYGLGTECVSMNEILRVKEQVMGEDMCGVAFDPSRILFTPNFAPKSEYVQALKLGVHVTVDNLQVLKQWPDVFQGQKVLIRIDPGTGKGHHQKVKTAGKQSKFGVQLDQVPELKQIASSLNLTIKGLHAHVGSGISDASSWLETASTLRDTADELGGLAAGLCYLDIGGGLGVDKGQKYLDELETLLQGFDRRGYELWMEPGRFLVSECGVLLCSVTQTKSKGDDRHYVGVTAGMNSLIRPALYDAEHPIVNLTATLENRPAGQWSDTDVVGPICETGDILGAHRSMPECREGDILCIHYGGAYGRSMSSYYNLRLPAQEALVESNAAPAQ